MSLSGLRVGLVLGALLLGTVGLAGAKTVTLRAADNDTTVGLNVGDTLVVELASSLPGEYRWVSVLAKGSVLSALNEGFEKAMDPKQAGGTQRFRYNAVRVGQSVLTVKFEAAGKAGAGVPQSTSRFEVKVKVESGAPAAGTAVLVGVYRGTMPCADCSGLDTELRLYAKTKTDTTFAVYVRRETYRGAPQGDVTLADRGEWTVLRGDRTDENATVYQLEPENEGRSTAFLVRRDGAELEQLDRDMLPMKGPGRLILRAGGGKR